MGIRGMTFYAICLLSAVAFGAVNYRGIFVCDEDWGLRPWACQHYGDKEQIGVNAYREIFAMMKEYGVNTIWPAMRAGGYEFVSRPANIQLAFEMNVTIGSSTGESMMRNPNYVKDREMWDFAKHADFLSQYWNAAVSRYGTRDVLWTLGMAGTRDFRKSGRTDAERIKAQGKIMAAQMALLEKSRGNRKDIKVVFTLNNDTVTLYDTGLDQVIPRDAIVIWPDDGFGYIRRLGGAQCAHRGGVLWKVSNIGYPYSYSHVCTTPPAFMWWELVARAKNNGAEDVWMVDVGDVFQAEPLIAALGLYGRDPNGVGPDAQSRVLKACIEKGLGVVDGRVDRFVAHLTEAYTLAFIRKPEFMSVDWLRRLPIAYKQSLIKRWTDLLDEDRALATFLTPAQRDRYFRLFGYMVRYLAESGLYFSKWETYTEADEAEAKVGASNYIAKLNARWDRMDNGKWSGFFPNPAAEEYCVNTNGSTRNVMLWPWLGPCPDVTAYNPDEQISWTPAGAATELTAGKDEGCWREVAGLGTSGRALALIPSRAGTGVGATATYQIDVGPDATLETRLILQFLPDYETVPGVGMGVRVSVNDGPPIDVKIPWVSAKYTSRDYVRRLSVMDNFVRIPVNVRLNAGVNTIRVIGWTPGVALDQIGIQKGGTPVRLLSQPQASVPVGQACGDCGPYANGCVGTIQSPKVSPNRLADFGTDAYGWLEIRGKGTYKLRVGEKAVKAKVELNAKSVYGEEVAGLAKKEWSRVPLTQPPAKDGAAPLPPELGVIRPFRYVEVPQGCEVRRVVVNWPVSDAEATFDCSDSSLTREYEEARQKLVSSSYSGYLTNGDPARLLKADGIYLNLLAGYAVDASPTMATRTLDMAVPTAEWPIADRQQAILSAYEHYLHTGDAEDVKVRLPTLKIGKVDTKGFDGVMMATTYRDLVAMAELSRAAHLDSELVDRYGAKAAAIKAAFNQKLWDTQEGVYRDAEGADVHSVYLNALAIAFGLAEGPQLTRASAWLARQKPPAGTLGELVYFQALYRAGRARKANALLAADKNRGWGDTAPVYLVAREILGVKEKTPGGSELTITPQPGNLRWMKGAVPTLKGPVKIDLRFDGRNLAGTIETPVPAAFTWDGKTENLPAGEHKLTR